MDRIISKAATAVAACTLASLIAGSTALAQTRTEQCDLYARGQSQSTPTTSGLARGAIVGAAAGEAFGSGAGRGAAYGAAVGGTRKAAQRGRSYQSYYDRCMRGLS